MSFTHLVEQLNSILLQKELKLVTAESCTGGMISAAITSVAGSSSVYERGFVTYSNEAKVDLLNVSTNILNHYGAVSAQCADAMVLGALNNSRADLGVSVTGIAGPGGATPEKPVGLVYIGVGLKGREPEICECIFNGSREDIRNAATEKALTLLVEAALTV